MAAVGCRVLVVDDNRDAAEAAGGASWRWPGHEVKAVGDGAEALASAPVFAPDVVVLDIGLPGDGRLRGRAPPARACRRRAPSLLIALTGYGQRGDRDRARDAGFDHHLTKPAEPDELLAIIEAWRAARAAATADEPVPRTGNLRDATSRR